MPVSVHDAWRTSSGGTRCGDGRAAAIVVGAWVLLSLPFIGVDLAHPRFPRPGEPARVRGGSGRVNPPRSVDGRRGRADHGSAEAPPFPSGRGARDEAGSGRLPLRSLRAAKRDGPPGSSPSGPTSLQGRKADIPTSCV